MRVLLILSTFCFVVNGLAVPNRQLDTKLGASTVPLPLSVEATSTRKAKSSLLLYDDEGFPQLGSIARLFPKNTFEIDTKQSLFYFGVDAVAVVSSMSFLNAVVNSDFYLNLPIWQQGLMVAPLQVLTGFAMWCTWCIGHDA